MPTTHSTYLGEPEYDGRLRRYPIVDRETQVVLGYGDWSSSMTQAVLNARLAQDALETLPRPAAQPRSLEHEPPAPGTFPRSTEDRPQ